MILYQIDGRKTVNGGLQWIIKSRDNSAVDEDDASANSVTRTSPTTAAALDSSSTINSTTKYILNRDVQQKSSDLSANTSSSQINNMVMLEFNENK